MKLMKGADIMTVKISELLEPNWDVRSTPEDEAGIIALSNSIKKDGFINPITCIRVGKKYKLIAGRRRLKAAKLAGLKEIPIYVKDDINAEIDFRRVALIENCHRKDMLGSERAKGFFMVYEMAGYTKEQVIGGVKSIDNWFSQDKSRTWQGLTTEVSSVVKGPQADPLRYDPKFIEICKDIGFSPKYQYQLMQILLQLKPEVLRAAEDAKLTSQEKILLTTRPLRDHPLMQKQLIKEIQNDLPKKRVQERVQQIAKDLETGYLELAPKGTGYIQHVGGDMREIVKGADEVMEPLHLAHLDLTDAVNNFMHRMTNHRLTKGEFEYTDKHLEATKAYRLDVIKAASERGLISMEQEVNLVIKTGKQFLQLIDQELEAREFKKKVSTK